MRARRAIEFRKDAAHVILDRLFGEVQRRADLLIRHAGDDQPDDFDFPARELVGIRIPIVGRTAAQQATRDPRIDVRFAAQDGFNRP